MASARPFARPQPVFACHAICKLDHEIENRKARRQIAFRTVTNGDDETSRRPATKAARAADGFRENDGKTRTDNARGPCVTRQFLGDILAPDPIRIPHAHCEQWHPRISTVCTRNFARKSQKSGGIWQAEQTDRVEGGLSAKNGAGKRRLRECSAALNNRKLETGWKRWNGKRWKRRWKRAWKRCVETWKRWETGNGGNDGGNGDTCTIPSILL